MRHETERDAGVIAECVADAWTRGARIDAAIQRSTVANAIAGTWLHVVRGD